MKKVIATLVASLFASAAFAQASATTSQAEPAKAEVSKPVRSTLKPEPDIAGATATDEASKASKHKKAKAHKKAEKSETALVKTEPAAETK